MNKETAKRMVEEKYLNVGRVLSDEELMRLGPVMNAEYKRLIGLRARPLDEFGLPMTDFEIAKSRIEENLKSEGYDMSNKYDKKLYRAELDARLLKWAKEWQKKQK